MARIGSTFTADQQFESFTRMPAFLIGVCTAPVRLPHNLRNYVRRTGALFRTLESLLSTDCARWIDVLAGSGHLRSKVIL